jgi:hypothetical protein
MDDLYIKAATVVAVALAAFSSFPSPAQQEQQPTQQVQPAPAQNPASAGNDQPSPAAAQLTPVKGELQDKLDSKSAKQGDSVVVKTKEDLKFPGGADIPKGSKLIGHVTNVQARADGKENSQIAIQFDRAELKGGQNMAIESVIRSVSPAEGSGADNSVPGAYGANAGVQSAPVQGAPVQGAPVQGAQGGMASSSSGMSGSNGGTNPESNHPGLASNTTAQPGGTDQTTSTRASTGMPAPGSILARNGNVAIRATSIPGVLLANDINGLPFTNASGMLLGARRDIHLDGGTEMVVAVAAAPAGAGAGMSR